MALSVGVSNGRQRPRLCGSSAQFVAKLAASPSRTVVTAVQVGQLSSLAPRSSGSFFALRTSRVSTSVVCRGGRVRCSAPREKVGNAAMAGGVSARRHDAWEARSICSAAVRFEAERTVGNRRACQSHRLKFARCPRSVVSSKTHVAACA